MTPLPNLEAKIVIVGCGISGIGAALKLIKNGFKNVRIIEATGRSGGRIRTGRLGEFDEASQKSLCNPLRYFNVTCSAPFFNGIWQPDRRSLGQSGGISRRRHTKL